MNQKQIQIIKRIVSNFFKDDYGKPFILTDTQAEIVGAIFLKHSPRVQIETYTQFGKSDSVSMGVILRVYAYGESFAVVGGTQEKADIIMRRIIQHIFDDKRLYGQLELDMNEPLQRLKRERNKKSLSFRNGGEIKTFSGDSRNRQRVKEALIGFGCPNLIEEEASIIEDDLHSTAMRMLTGHKDNFLVKIGNTVFRDKPRSHFYRTSKNKNYYKIWADYNLGIKEGRITEEAVEEMRLEMNPIFFRMYYECLFPNENVVDVGGYYRTVTDEELDNALGIVEHKGKVRIGIDVGEGHDLSVIVKRSDTLAEILYKTKTADQMTLARELFNQVKDEKFDDLNVDAVGVGAGVASYFEEQLNGNKVKWSESPTKENSKYGYKNLKAQNFDDVASWIRNGGKLKPHEGWEELRNIRQKEDSTGKLKIKTKEEMQKEGIPSPNYADGLALSFNEKKFVGITII
jgi:hypothetical protein